MDPAQFSCSFELLRSKRPGDDDFGIVKMIFETVVATEVHNFQLWEVLAQALGKPFGSVPEIEAMMKQDEKFHRTFEPRRTLRYTKGSEVLTADDPRGLQKARLISFARADRARSFPWAEGYPTCPARLAKCHATNHLASGKMSRYLRRR